MASSNSSSKRLFIAIKPSIGPTLRNTIQELQDSGQFTQTKWVEYKNLHVTLFFLGNTPDYFVNSIQNIIASVAKHNKTFELVIKSINYFGRHNPTLLWAGIEPKLKLTGIHKELADQFSELGYTKKIEKFTPHLTLGRSKKNMQKQNVDTLIEPHKEKFFQSELVDEIYLFESILKKSGPEYNILDSFKLGY